MLWKTLPHAPVQAESIEQPQVGLERLSALQREHQLRSSPPEFPSESLLCVTTSRSVYLAHHQNRSPAITIAPLSELGSITQRDPSRVKSRLENRADSLTLLLFDLDAPYQMPESGRGRGAAPQWVNLTPLSELSLTSIQRAPLLLWAVDGLSRSTRLVPNGLGGVELRLRGKSPHQVRVGRPWLNDYTSWFRSAAIAGQYVGYDGPCVAWNDSRVRHRVLALAFARARATTKPEDARTEPESGWLLLRQALESSSRYAIGGWVTALPQSESDPISSVSSQRSSHLAPIGSKEAQ